MHAARTLLLPQGLVPSPRALLTTSLESRSEPIGRPSYGSREPFLSSGLFARRECLLVGDLQCGSGRRRMFLPFTFPLLLSEAYMLVTSRTGLCLLPHISRHVRIATPNAASHPHTTRCPLVYIQPTSPLPSPSCFSSTQPQSFHRHRNFSVCEEVSLSILTARSTSSFDSPSSLIDRGSW